MTDGFTPPDSASASGPPSQSGNQPRVLELWQTYSREEAHDIFDPQSKFTPQTGAWGISGIVSIRERPGDFVFFVTFGSKQGDHDFDESIDKDGVLTWQSQPDQKLSDPQIKTFIAHDDLINTIHLFPRTKKTGPYTYFGTLGNLGHDPSQEKPVHFTWQLLDGTPPDPVLQTLNLVLQPSPPAPAQPSISPAPSTEPQPGAGMLTKTPPPVVAPPNATTSKPFGAGRKQAVLPGQDAKNTELGNKGEHLVLKAERGALLAAGKPDLAAQIVHVSFVEGDSAGYDIRSFNPDGSHRHIEVKTTRGPSTNAFFATSHEVRFSEQHPDTYVLIRVYGYTDHTDSAQFYEVPGPLSTMFGLTPSQYRVRLHPTPVV